MFTLAQYVFGIGKSDLTSIDDNCSSNDTAYHENDDPNQCVQTNIENDWILIEIEQKKSNLAKNEAKTLSGSRKLRSARSRAKELRLQEESWFVEPPECFKNTSPDCLDVKTSSLENLLIEHPSMSVFDNLFTKQVLPNTKSEQLKTIKPNPKQSNSKKSDNCKENALAVRSNNNNNNTKKKPVEVAPVNLLTVSNQNKALTAVIKSGETFNKKKCITKKNYERKNKVAIQRNGPIIRHKKMFAHLNGVYHNRNNC